MVSGGSAAKRARLDRVSSDASFEPDASIEGCVQRAQLLAGLGRYDEAVAELDPAVALEPGNLEVLTTLARVQLAAQRPAEALAAADAALERAPDFLPALVLRGMALADLRRFGEAAMTAERVLALGPDDPYAQRSGAALLAESRNGQPALDAAWRGVQLAPEEPDAHLVLALVAARLHLFDLAERAYREALRLDPSIGEVRDEPGVVRLERRRYAVELEMIVETAVPASAQFEGLRVPAGGLRRFLLVAAGYFMVSAVMAAAAATVDTGASRVWAAVLVIVGGVVAWIMAARLPGPLAKALPPLFQEDRPLTVAGGAVAAAGGLILLYALVGVVWPLVLAIVATAVAKIAVLRGSTPQD